MRIALVGLVLVVVVASARGQEAPSTGLLYNTKETHSLFYSCDKQRDGTLQCEFNQLRVRKKASQDELEKKLKAGREEFKAKSQKISAEDCKEYSTALAVLEGRAKPPKEPQRPLTANQKKDYAEMVKAILLLCKSPTEENWLNLIKLGHAKEMRTCRVSAWTYKQTFRPISDGVSKLPAWVVAQGGPEGPCGLVNLSRFEADKPRPNSDLTFWKYTARKAVTNPQGSFMGQSCNMFDEGEYLYDWKSEEHSMDCDYIEFSVL